MIQTADILEDILFEITVLVSTASAAWAPAKATAYGTWLFVCFVGWFGGLFLVDWRLHDGDVGRLVGSVAHDNYAEGAADDNAHGDRCQCLVCLVGWLI